MTDKLAVALAIIVLAGTFLLVALTSHPILGKADSLIPKNRPPISYQSRCGVA